MSISIEQFEEFFGALHQDKEGRPLVPFSWQSQLARQVADDGWPECIDLPTASGKTAAIDIAVFVLACQAGIATNDRKVGRRIFFTVNRRVIVDEAFDRSLKIAKKLLVASAGILKTVADALGEISGDASAPPLDVAQLRGGVYRDRAWARSITQPTVVCTTADQLGSRLLFRGYGVSASMQPVHAALTACDSLILLDEAHATKAFSQTLGLLSRYRQQESTSPPLRFVQMTATPAGDIPADKRFRLKVEDQYAPENIKLLQRQESPKVAELVSTGKKPLVEEFVKRAIAALSEQRQAIGIIVNRVQIAREIHAKLAEKYGEDAFLVIGRMRPLDRDALQEQLKTLVGPDRPPVLAKPCFVVATQCLEVGADYDFDALFTECASIDALRQRFGRLNRQGRKIEVAAAVLTTDTALKDEDPIYGDALKETWKWMREGGREQIDFGIIAFNKLWNSVDEKNREPMLAPAPNAAVLLPAHLDALCQTAPYPQPSPDVSFFIHGPQRDNAEVNVCWRADLGDDEQFWAMIVGMLPPTSPECMTVPLRTVANWMRGKATRNDADVAIRADEDDSKESSSRSILIWRGKDKSESTSDPRDLRPGDTIVLPANFTDAVTLGHIPKSVDGSPQLDLAEIAYAKARRQRIVRVHPAIHPELPIELRQYSQSDDRPFLSKAQIRELLGSLAAGFTSGPEVIEYPNAAGLLLRFNKLLPEKNPFRPSREDDDGDDSPLESSEQVSLRVHTQHVVERVAAATERLNLNGLQILFRQAAKLHDIGKADVRFQAMLAGLSPYEAMDRLTLLAKSGQIGLTRKETDEIRRRAQLPNGFRHEMLSLEIVASGKLKQESALDCKLLLHLIAAHHGHARPFAPIVIDNSSDETLSVNLNDVCIAAEERRSWIPSHRLDAGVAERFWNLTRSHGWWGLAWLEAILRLADQQASAWEQEGTGK